MKQTFISCKREKKLKLGLSPASTLTILCNILQTETSHCTFLRLKASSIKCQDF